MRSPAAPSNDRTAIANALINNRRSRRSGRETCLDESPIPKRMSLMSRKPASMPQRLPVVPNQDPRRDSRFAGHQAPRFVHLRILYAHDRADRQLVRVGHPSTHQSPRTPPGTDPRGGRSPLTARIRHIDVSTQPIRARWSAACRERLDFRGGVHARTSRPLGGPGGRVVRVRGQPAVRLSGRRSGGLHVERGDVARLGADLDPDQVDSMVRGAVLVRVAALLQLRQRRTVRR